MDGLSVAASVVSIATVGIQISIKLVTLATQISTASDRVSSISGDVSLTSGVLQQLGELMAQKETDDRAGINIFSQGALKTTEISAKTCESIFREIDKATKTASEQICGHGRIMGRKVKLSRTEQAKWPFLQPGIETLRVDLREAKGTLMLMLQVTTLGFSKRMADLNRSASASITEQRDMAFALLAIYKEQQRIASDDHRSRDYPNKTKQQDTFLASKTPSISLDISRDETALASNATSKTSSFNTMKQNLMMSVPLRQQPPAEKSIKRDLGARNIQFEPRPASGHSSVDQGIPIPSDNPSQASVYSYSLNQKFMTSRDCQVSDARRRSIENNQEKNDEQKEFDFFLLKPVIKDFYDIIQLSWTVRNLHMGQSEIRKQLAKNEQEGLPAVWEVRESLYAHESSVVDKEISVAGPGASLASIKRTNTDIQHREITFKGVPGLQFVVQLSSSRKIEPGVKTSARGTLRRTKARIGKGEIQPQVPEPILKASTVTEQGYDILPTHMYCSRPPVGSPGKIEGVAVDTRNEIRNEAVDLISIYELLTNNVLEAKEAADSTDPGDLIVEQDGVAEDEEGDSVGRVVRVAFSPIYSHAIDERNNVKDKHGNMRGRVTPYEEAEDNMDSASIDTTFDGISRVEGLTTIASSLPIQSDDDGYASLHGQTPNVETLTPSAVAVEEPYNIVMSALLEKYNIKDDWRNYWLSIVYGDQEMRIEPEQKPMKYFKRLDKAGLQPSWKLRQTSESIKEYLTEPGLPNKTIIRKFFGSPVDIRPEDSSESAVLYDPNSGPSLSKTIPTIIGTIHPSRQGVTPRSCSSQYGAESGRTTAQNDQIAQKKRKLRSESRFKGEDLSIATKNFSVAARRSRRKSNRSGAFPTCLSFEKTEEEGLVDELLAKYTTLFEY